MRSHTASKQLDESGATAVEYALLASLIAAVIVVTVFALGTKVFGLYSDTCHKVAGAINGSTC